MAKKKVGRPKKKSKYTRHIPEYIKTQQKLKNVESLQEAVDQAKNGDTIFVNPPQSSAAEQQRASKDTYVFINGCKVQVRSLSDEVLNNHYERIRVAAFEARRNTTLLEKIGHDMDKEQRFRGLK